MNLFRYILLSGIIVTLLPSITIARDKEEVLLDYNTDYYTVIVLNVPQYPQKTNCWCGVTNVEMWSDWLSGNNQSQKHQEIIAKRGGYNCNNGVDINELVTALEKDTPNWFGKYYTTNQDNFSDRITHNLIKNKKPVVVVGNTRYKNGTIKANKHWYLVKSAAAIKKTVCKKITYYDSIRGIITYPYCVIKNKLAYLQINDTLYNSDFTNKFFSANPNSWISKDKFYSTYASNKYKKRYYLAED